MMTKQRQKFDIEKMAHSTLTADNKMLMETCEQLEKKRHRLEHDLQMKEAQLLNMEDSYIQTKKLLDVEIHKVDYFITFQSYGIYSLKAQYPHQCCSRQRCNAKYW